MTVGLLSGVAATPRVAVTDEKVWLTDARLASVADPTGVADSAAGIRAAVALADTAIPGTNGSPVIGVPTGIFKCLSNVYIPMDVGFETAAKSGGSRLHFPSDTGAPTLASLGLDAVAGVSSVQYVDRVGSAFNAASALSPQTVHIDRSFFTYTGVTVSTATTGTLTGCVGFPGAVGAGTGNPPSMVQDYAMTFAGGSAGRYTAIGEGIIVVGPGVGSFAAWGTETPPNSLDGLFLGTFAHADCMVSGFRHAAAFTTDHQGFGSSYNVTSCYSAIHAASPAQSFGNQLIESGARLDGQFWAGVYIDTDQVMNVVTFGEQVAFGNAPWGVWKAGAAPVRTGMITDSVMIQPTFEGMGLGLFGSEDGTGVMSAVEILGSNALFNPAWLPVGSVAPEALFKCTLNRVAIRGRQTLFLLGVPTGATAAFVSDYLSECVFENFDGIATSGDPIAAPVALAQTQVNDCRFERGQIYGTLGAVDAGDVVGFRSAGTNATVQTAQFPQQAIAGVAVADSQNNVVALAQHGFVDVNVAPGAPGASLPGGGVNLARLNNAAAGKATAASSWGDTNGQVFAYGFFAADDGEKATMRLCLPAI